MKEYIVIFNEDEKGVARTWDILGEIVRCKDCFYHGYFDENGYCVCEISGAGMQMDGFCSDGERKKWL